MRHKIPSTILIAVMLVTLVVTLGAAPAISPDTGAPIAEAAIAVLPPQEGGSAQAVARLEPVAIGAMRSYGTHLVPPSRTVLDAQLAKEGVPLDASEEQVKAARERYRQRFAKQSETWISPKFQQWAIEREAELASSDLGVQAIQPVTATVYAMAVDFGATETFTLPVEQDDGTCLTETVTIAGPLAGQMAPPGPRDNFTLWYSPSLTSDSKFYEKIIFGYEGAGRARYDMIDPDDGLPGINLAGYTVQDYFDNVAGEGNVYITGTVEGWVTVPHSEGLYGANNCQTGSSGGGLGVPVAQLVIDAIDVFSATHPSYWTDPDYWPTFDANDDGVLDTFWVIHAGAGEEGGGGEQGDFAIWSHSSDLRNYAQWPDGYKVYEGDPSTADDDIVVGPYTMQPENSETGVFAEEFGHNFFGLPDLYTTDGSNSIGNWNIMSGGAWMGWLGGTTPASMPLWFKMIAAFEADGVITPVNWQEPMVTRAYDDEMADVTIGQLEKTPAGVEKGVRVNLPSYTASIDNEAGTGKGAYSGTGRDQTDITLDKSIEVSAGVTGTLTMAVYYEIEEDWDYAYVMVNGATIADMDGVTTDFDPNGNNLGNGITGHGEGTLRFDLSSYAGETVTLTLRYKTDAAVTEAGIWLDDVVLDGALIDDFEGASVPGTFDQWTNSDPGWLVIPTTATHNRYYLVEWRSKTKYDGMIAKTAYLHNEITDTEDIVQRIPYNMPAALLYYRDTKYGSTYAIGPNRYDPPSVGSKYQLLIVDMNWQALRAGDTPETYEWYWTGRLSSYDSGLTLQDTQPFTITQYWDDPGLGPWTYPSKPAVETFNDTLGYYAGYYFGDPCPAGYVCLAERDGSAVIPARDLYSTRIAEFDYSPIFGFYGYPWSPSWFGSGNPGDDNVQFGVNIDLLSKDGDDAYNSTATLRFRNYSVDFVTTATSNILYPDYQVTYQTEIRNIGKETAYDVGYEIYLDPALYLVSIDTDGAPSASASSVGPNDGLGLTIDEIAAGETVTVTVVAKMPFAAGEVDLESELWGYDGQVERGPWFVATTGMNSIIYMPLISK